MKPTILIIEDNPADVKLLTYAFEPFRDQVRLESLPDGEAALKRLLGPGGQGPAGDVPALVLLDLKLPLVTGLEVLDAVKRHHVARLIPIVALTSSNQPRDIEYCYKAGVNAFVVKPTDFDGYVRLVESVMDFWIGHNLVHRAHEALSPTPEP